MRYKVTKNGNIITVTDTLKTAVDDYNRTIYDAKPGDFIEILYRPRPEDKWVRLRKDWI